MTCPASLGGCKHAVAFLMWVHRRSEEPSCTSKNLLLEENCQLLKHQPDFLAKGLDRFGMHNLSFNYINENDMNKFLNEIVPLFTKQVIDLIECETREQHKIKPLA
ncbi:hypothetical protein ACJJTC_003371 [Scirpophaga incertulas]